MKNLFRVLDITITFIGSLNTQEEQITTIIFFLRFLLNITYFQLKKMRIEGIKMKVVLIGLVFLILLLQVEAKSQCKRIEVFEKCLQNQSINPTRYSSCVNEEMKLCKGEVEEEEEIKITKRSRVASKCTRFIWVYTDVMAKYCFRTRCYWFKYKTPVKMCTMS